MPKICYVPKDFGATNIAVILQANRILEEYEEQGFDLTLRQLYYQFVSRGIIPNNDREYKRLGNVVSDARLAGLIDWDHIVDRTRNMRQNSHWQSPQEVIQSCAKQFQINKWSDQPNYVEVWIEKDALVGVIEGVCSREDVPYFSCRGYTSQSEMWSAAMRLMTAQRAGKECHIIHLGDHDPSGIDMSRDIQDRLDTFMNHHVIMDYLEGHPRIGDEPEDEFIERTKAEIQRSWKPPIVIHRIALNMDQVEEYNPPPNPAKITDSRATSYISQHGDSSWELDALEPAVLVNLISAKVDELRNEDIWYSANEIETEHRQTLGMVHKHWDSVKKYLAKKG